MTEFIDGYYEESMTESKAIKDIQHDLKWHSKELKPAYKKSLRFAIQALEEIQAYRAIGTVEELQAIKSSTQLVTDVLAEYSSIGTIEAFKALKEKSEPKKPQEISWGATKCPICGQEFGFNSHFNHCSNCGQKLDWE